MCQRGVDAVVVLLTTKAVYHEGRHRSVTGETTAIYTAKEDKVTGIHSETFGEGADYSGAMGPASFIHVTWVGSVAVRENGGLAFDNADEAAPSRRSTRIKVFPSRNTVRG